jgi:glycerol-3-phosphate acyltransferase PlsY
MSFGDHAVLWLHITAAVFTIGPGTAAIMSTPRYIKKRNPVVVGYLLRTTRIYSFGALLTLIFGLILTGMTHKFSQWWISASLTLFVVAFVLLLIIMRDQRKALTALDAAEGAAVADAVEDGVRSEASGDGAAGVGGTGGQPAIAAPAATTTATGLRVTAAVERGRIASLGGLTALIWLVILVFMVWH